MGGAGCGQAVTLESALMQRLRQAGLTVLSSLMLAGALPNDLWPDGSLWLGLVALAPYFLAVYRSRTHREAMWLGALFGALSTVAGTYWLLFFQEFAIWTLGGTALGYMLFHGALAPILRGRSKNREKSL